MTALKAKYLVYSKDNDCLYPCSSKGKVEELLEILLERKVPDELLVIEPKTISVLKTGFRPVKNYAEFKDVLTEEWPTRKDDDEDQDD